MKPIVAMIALGLCSCRPASRGMDIKVEVPVEVTPVGEQPKPKPIANPLTVDRGLRPRTSIRVLVPREDGLPRGVYDREPGYNDE